VYSLQREPIFVTIQSPETMSIFEAINTLDVDRVKLLVSQDKDVINQRNEKGQTPVMTSFRNYLAFSHGSSPNGKYVLCRHLEEPTDGYERYSCEMDVEELEEFGEDIEDGEEYDVPCSYRSRSRKILFFLLDIPGVTLYDKDNDGKTCGEYLINFVLACDSHDDEAAVATFQVLMDISELFSINVSLVRK